MTSTSITYFCINVCLYSTVWEESCAKVSLAMVMVMVLFDDFVGKDHSFSCETQLCRTLWNSKLEANYCSYVVDLHRPLSNLAYAEVESGAQCAPPPPLQNITLNYAEAHTPRILQSIEAFNTLLTLSGDLKAHTPFVICQIANTTIAHLSACRHVLQGQALKLAREKIRLNMGVLKALGETWSRAKRTYRELGAIAREVLCLADQDISPLTDLSSLTTAAIGPLDFTLDTATDLMNILEFEQVCAP